MSSTSKIDDILSKVSAALEESNGTKIGRIEYLGCPSELEDYVKESNGYYNHITELDEQNYPMSDDKEGELCIAFPDGQGVLLLRDLFEKYPIWSPDSVFKKESGMFSKSEKKRLMLKTYYEGCPYGAKSAILCRFVWKDDMDDLCWKTGCGKEAYGAYYLGEDEDNITDMCEYHKKELRICDDCHHTPKWCYCEDCEENVSAPSIMAESNAMSPEDKQAADEYDKKMVDAGKVRLHADGYYISQPPSEWKDGEDKEKALAEIEAINKRRKEEEEQAKAIELLISNGMLKRNAEGELEFQRLPYKPTRIGVITPNS